MNLLADIRRHELRASRLIAAIFATAWLGLIAAPCAAATGLECAGSSHQGSLPAGDCDDCPAAASGSDGGCAMVAAPDCLSQGQALLAGRDAGSAKPQAGPPPTPLFPDATVPVNRCPVDVTAQSAPVPQVSIQKRYCTYLK